MPTKNIFSITKLERERLKQRCDALGIGKIAQELGLAKDSILRILAGQPVRNGTVALFKEAMKRFS